MADPVVTSHHARTAPSDETVTVTLDGQPVEAHKGELLIEVAERAGTYVPRFCYHPRMKPVGMCRMCLVEVSGPRGPSLQPACYLGVADGMEVSTTSDRVRKAQDGVLEFLLVNHPLDCPVCDKGGECPLQDQVLSYGPGESRFVEEKRHWAKPIPISDLVLLDRERCIQCGRCVRFAAEVAGEAQIDLAARGDRVEVAIFEHQPFDSVFSGNTVQICPVGALTAVPYRFTARPWDVDQVESTCTTCAVGCRVAVQSSANRVTRLLGIDSDPVNHSWLCDKGRFVATATGSPDRLVEPLVRSADGRLEPASWDRALSLVADRLRRVRDDQGPSAIGVLGGARLTNEDAYAWARLAKGVLGTDSVDAQLGDGLPAEVALGLPRATIDQAASAKALVLLCGDLRQELPVLYLRLRAAVVDGDTAVVELGPVPSALGALGVHVAHRPGDGPVVARALIGGGAAPDGVDADALGAARAVLGPLGDGDGVVVVVGRPSLAEDGALPAAAALALAEAWPRARFLPALRRGNVMGALDMGLAPGLLPGRVTLDAGREWFTAAWGAVPAERGRDAAGMLAGLADGSMQALVLLGADPLGDFPDRQLAERALDRAPFVVAVDAFLSPSAARADVVLPVATAHERGGSTTNIEGRVTRLAAKVVAPGRCSTDWMVAAELADRLGAELPVASVADLTDEIEQLAPAYRGVTRRVLDGPAGRDGVVVPVAATPVTVRPRAVAAIDPMATPGIESVERQGAPPRAGWSEPLGGADDEATTDAARQAAQPATRPDLLGVPAAGTLAVPTVPPVDGYGLRLVATRRLYDDGVTVDVVDALAALVEDPVVHLHPADLATVVADGHPARVRLRSPAGALDLPAEADAAVPRGVAVVPFNVAGEPAEVDGQPAGTDGPSAGTDSERTGAGDRASSERTGSGAVATAASLVTVGTAVTPVRLEGVRP
jgi:NADH-quinone oxidoreductase subunit G